MRGAIRHIACHVCPDEQSVLVSVALLIGGTHHEREAQFPLAPLVHHVLRPSGNRRVEFLCHLLSTADDWKSDWCGCIQSFDRHNVVESTVGEESGDFEWQGCDVVDQSLDRVARGSSLRTGVAATMSGFTRQRTNIARERWHWEVPLWGFV